MTRIYLVRHGQTDWNAIGRITTRTDRPLTARGEGQALDLGRYLAAERHVRFDAIYASPLIRAARSAELIRKNMIQYAPVSPTHAAPIPEIVIEPRAVEVDAGPFEGWTEDMIAQDAGAQAWRAGEHIAGAEHDSDAALRAMAVLEDLIALGGTILLVSHGHFIKLLIAHGVLDIPIGKAKALKIYNTAPAIVESKPHGLALTALNLEPPRYHDRG